MSRELHFRKKDNKYNVWSTISDSYVYKWADKQTIKKLWLLDLIEEQIDKIEEYIEEIDEEV